jgi:(p)ppGpp synthase/HD superfamily hydrolase
MEQQDLLEKAIGIAVAAHRGQRDRCGAAYILHPLRVMGRLNSPEEKMLGVLHDVVEDTEWTFEALAHEGFPPAILEALDCLTKREGEPYEDFVVRSAGNSLAKKVKLADLEDNMDPRRLTGIEEKDLARLGKYVKAWRSLSGLS